jgi:hypothetical protein
LAKVKTGLINVLQVASKQDSSDDETDSDEEEEQPKQAKVAATKVRLLLSCVPGLSR